MGRITVAVWTLMIDSDKKYLIVIQKLMKSKTIKMQGKGHPELGNYIM